MDLEQARVTDAQRVAGALAGDQGSFGELFNEYFDRVYDVAFRIVRNREVAAEVAQDTFLAAWAGLVTLEDQASFGGWVLRISRNRALNRLSRERRSVALGDEVTTAVADSHAPNPDMHAGLAADESNDLVWAAAAALGERDASVLDLHLRHGLSGAALADELGVTPNNANQILHAMKGRLEGAVRAFVLWRNGNPDCPDLRGALARQSDVGFGVVTARLIRRHLKACGLCDAEQRRHLAPAAMFSAVPVLVAPLALRTQAAGALTASGVPMGTAAPPPAPPSVPSGSAGPDGSVAGPSGSPMVDPNPGGPADGVELPEPPPPGAGAATEVIEAIGGPDSLGADAASHIESGESGESDSGTRRKVLAMLGGAAVLLLLLGGWVVSRGDDAPTGPVVARPPTSPAPAATSSSTSSTTSATTSTTTSTTAPPSTSAPDTSVRSDDPEPGSPGASNPITPVAPEDRPPTAPTPPVPSADPPQPPPPGEVGPTPTERAVEETTTVVDLPDQTEPTDITRKQRDPTGPNDPPVGTPVGSPPDGGPAGPF